MSQARLSKRTVDGAEPRGREYIVWDAELTGFGLRVRPSGAKSYILTYRAGRGRQAPVRKLTLGSAAKITPDVARALAKTALGQVALGADPAGLRRERHAPLNLKELAATFLDEHVCIKRKPTTAAHYRYVLERFVVPQFGLLRPTELSRVEVARLHHKLRDRPATANYVVAVLGAMFSFGDKHGLVPEGVNPTAKITKYTERRRERFLTTYELGRLGAALREAETIGLDWDLSPDALASKHLPKAANRVTRFDPSVCAAIRLLMFTGCRLREILHLKWEEFDTDRGLLLLPDSKTGRKTVVLNAVAIDVLTAVPRLGPYVFPGKDPSKPRHDLKRAWAAVCARAGLAGLRIHDLRHTFASYGAGAGLGLPIVGKLLGHSQPRTTARYAHLDADPVRRASEQISESIAAALNGPMNVPLLPVRKAT